MSQICNLLCTTKIVIAINYADMMNIKWDAKDIYCVYLTQSKTSTVEISLNSDKLERY